MIFLKKYWPLILAAVVLFWIAFRSCNNPPSHKENKKAMDSVGTAWAAERKADAVRIAALQRSNDSTQRLLDTTRRALNEVRRDAAARIIAVKQTLTTGAEAARRRDTSAILVNWDSLRAQVAAGLPVVVARDSLSEIMIATCIEQGRVKDSIAAVYKIQSDRADTAINFQQAKYAALTKDYNKTRINLKFNKTLGRIEAVVILAALAKIFIFK